MKLEVDIEQYDVISLDIFDTLWLRAVANPIDIFPYVWKEAVEREITIMDLTPYEFLKLRVELERRARSKVSHREITLKDIYQEIPPYIVSDVETLMDIELKMEKKLGYLNPDIVELMEVFHHKGGKLVLISDMYLNSGQMTELLKSDGFNINLIEEVIVSCEKKCNKQNGLLYQELGQLFPSIDKNRILHIGDNRSSDYEQAIKYGVQVYHYDVIPTKMNSRYDYEKIRHDNPQPAILSLRKLASQQNFFESDSEKLAYEIGASIVGPYLTFFASHIGKRLQQLNTHAIYPLMREGYLLGELLKNECEDQHLSIQVKPIYTSRKVSYIAAIEKIDREEIENIIGVRNLTILELIQVLGLNKDSFDELKGYFDIKLKTSHTIQYCESTLKEYVINRLIEPKHVAKIEEYVKNHRKLYVDYLKQEIDDLADAATVDLGWIGRIQQWTEKALYLEGCTHQLKHFFAMGITGERVFDGIQIEGYAGTFAANEDLLTTMFRTPDLLEKLVSVCVGSTIGYTRTQKGIFPMQSDAVGNDKLTNIVFEGVLNFQKYWFYFRKHKPDLARKVIQNRRDNLKIVHRLIDMPTLEEVKLLMNFEADTNFGTTYKEPIITKANLQLLEEKGVAYIDKCNVSYTYENSNIVWPKGLITLKDEFYYLRKALKNSAGNEIIKSMQEVVECVAEQGIKEVALYGAGENGRQFYFMCKLYGVKVNCFIDRKESLWGSEKEGVVIMGLEEAIENGNSNFIITSLFSIHEIEDNIVRKMNGKNKYQIFHV